MAYDSYSLRHILLNFIKMSDGCTAIAEAHQQGISMPTHLVVPNMPEAEHLTGMMNKNLPAFLFHTLKEQGLPDKFIDKLLQKSCKAAMLADMNHCNWDVVNRVLTTKEDIAQAKKNKAFEGAAWFCQKLPSYVPYKGTYVPYDGTFGAPDQGQMLDV